MQTDQTVISSGQRFDDPFYVPALTKAEVPWSSVRRFRLTHEHHVLKRVRGILNKLTPEKFHLLTPKLIRSGITTAYVLMGVVSLIYHKAVHEPIYCSMYAQLCSVLSSNLPPFPSDKPGRKEISFKYVLLNHCQEAFERADGPEERLLKLGNIRLIGELTNQRVIPEKIVHHIVQELLGRDNESCPEEENVEAICLLLNRIGKQLDGHPKSKRINDRYFDRLKDISLNPELAPRIRFVVLDVIDLRLNNWIPRREEVKPKTIAEIHMEAERDMGLRPGASASFRRGRT